MAAPGQRPALLKTAACPCASGQAYERCCGRWHAGPEYLLAPTPQALMRSRFSAFVLGLPDYLLQSWHASTRPAEPIVFDTGQHWLRLEVRHAPPAEGDHGEVEFVAISKVGGRAHRLHERSRFVREAGRWFYVDGDEL